jgi:hypothetical protein
MAAAADKAKLDALWSQLDCNGNGSLVAEGRFRGFCCLTHIGRRCEFG